MAFDEVATAAGGLDLLACPPPGLSAGGSAALMPGTQTRLGHGATVVQATDWATCLGCAKRKGTSRVWCATDSRHRLKSEIRSRVHRTN